MFCLKCGSQIPEGSNFCLNCGTPVASIEQNAAVNAGPVQPNVNTENVMNETPVFTSPAKPLNKKLIGIIAGAAAAVVVLVLVLVLCIGGGGPEGIAEAYYEAYFTFDFDEICELSPVDFNKLYDIDNAKLKEYQSEIKAQTDSISYDINAVGSEELDVEDGEDLLEDLRDDYGSKYVVKGEVEAYYEVTLEVEISAYGFSDSEKMTVNVIKVDGNWYIADKSELRTINGICKYDLEE